jgi:hypothetical protein
MAQLIEVTAHYGAMGVFALTGAKKLPPPGRVYEHPDRPGGPERRRVVTVAQFEETVNGGENDDDPRS